MVCQVNLALEVVGALREFLDEFGDHHQFNAVVGLNHLFEVLVEHIKLIFDWHFKEQPFLMSVDHNMLVADLYSQQPQHPSVHDVDHLLQSFDEDVHCNELVEHLLHLSVYLNLTHLVLHLLFLFQRLCKAYTYSIIFPILLQLIEIRLLDHLLLLLRFLELIVDVFHVVLKCCIQDIKDLLATRVVHLLLLRPSPEFLL